MYGTICAPNRHRRRNLPRSSGSITKIVFLEAITILFICRAMSCASFSLSWRETFASVQIDHCFFSYSRLSFLGRRIEGSVLSPTSESGGNGDVNVTDVYGTVHTMTASVFLSPSIGRVARICYVACRPGENAASRAT